MQAIVMYSGGIGSWAAGMRVVERYGREHTTLLFCDTKKEDEDLYRFLHEGAAVIGVPVTIIADGRTPWELFHGKGIIGNSRFPLCSVILKREVADAWVATRYAPDQCLLFSGMDFCQKEARRLEAMQARCAPYQVQAPLFWPPALDKDLAKLLALKHGLRLPRLYSLGFQHNNCGGACVKAGEAQWAHLYRVLPERFREEMAEEEAFQARTGTTHTILKDRRGGHVRPLALRQLAKEIDRSPELPFEDTDDACNCFV